MVGGNFCGVGLLFNWFEGVATGQCKWGQDLHLKL